MSVLLPTDVVDLYESFDVDVHGWQVPPDVTAPVWSGEASVQLFQSLSANQAADGGGRGPFSPQVVPLGNVYLPTESNARDGMLLVTPRRPGGGNYALSGVYLSADPTGGPLSCLVGVLSGFDLDGR